MAADLGVTEDGRGGTKWQRSAQSMEPVADLHGGQRWWRSSASCLDREEAKLLKQQGLVKEQAYIGNC